MKKIMFFAAAVAVFFTSCTKEQTVEDSTVYADVDRTDDATKVVMGGSDGTHTALNWNQGDIIAVYNVNSDNFGEYQTASSVKDGDATAAFTFVDGDKIVPGEPHLAGYPFDRLVARNFAFRYEETQNYTANSFDRMAMPMVAANQSGNSFTFKVQAAVLRLQVSTSASDVTVSSIVVTSKEKNLTGWALPDMEHYTYGVPSTYTGKEVSLVCESPVSIGGTATDFNIVVPGQEYPSEDLEITIHTNKGEIVKTSKKAVTFVSGKVYNIPVSCEPTPTPVPEGALPGKFSVSTSKKVYFSKGNLYYDGGKFNFETNQYEFQDSWSTSHVSLFHWSKNASVAYAENYSESGTSSSDVFFTNETETTAKAGFTVNVGGKEQSGWRTLSTAEWRYLFNNGSYASEIRKDRYKYGVTVCDKTNCVVIAPDDWDLTANPLQESYGPTSTPMTWERAEAAGLVCLPAAGIRSGSSVRNVGANGLYWSSSANGSSSAYYVGFGSGSVRPGDYGSRNNGYSVRLITDVNVNFTTICINN